MAKQTKTKAGKAIDKLIDKKGFKTQANLLREMHKTLDKTSDVESWVKNNTSNLNAKKRNERKFTIEDKYALSEISGLSFSRFIDGEDEFDPISLKFAAQKNDMTTYKRLLRLNNDAPSVKDEWNKYLLDHIVEYCDNATEMAIPIKFLFENKLCAYSESSEHVYKLLSDVITLDDPEIFKWYKINYLGRDVDVFTSRSWANGTYDEIKNFEHRLLSDILKSNNILADLLAPTYVPEKKYVLKGEKYDGNEEDLGIAIMLPSGEWAQLISPLYPFKLKERLLECAIKNEDMKSVDKIFESFREEIYKQAKEFKEKNGPVPYKHIHFFDGLLYSESGIYSDESVMAVKSEFYNLNGVTEEFLRERYKDRYYELDYENIRFILCERDLSTLNDGEILCDNIDKKIYHKCNKNTAYEMLDEAAKRGFDLVPEYYGEENGVQITELTSPVREVSLDDEIAALSSFHDFSKEILGDGWVYAYKNYSKKLLYRNKSGKLSFGGWHHGIEIKTPEYAFLETIAYALPIDMALPIDENEISIIKNAVNYYTHDTSLISNLADKLLEWINAKLSENRCVTQMEKSEYRRFSLKKIFVEMYRNKLNNI